VTIDRGSVSGGTSIVTPRPTRRFEEVSDTTETVDEAATLEEVSDTPPQTPAEEPAAPVEAEPQAEEVSDTTETVDEAATVEEVSDTGRREAGIAAGGLEPPTFGL
jgi:hypothetical protein